MNLTNQIQFLAEIENIDFLLSVGNIGVFPSVYEELFSNVIGEAEKNKKSSIIFNSGGMPELISHKEDGYICKNKTEKDLIEGVISYLKSPEQMKIQGANAFNFIDKLGLDDDTFRNKWIQVYDRF